MIHRHDTVQAKDLEHALASADPAGSALEGILPDLRRHLEAEQMVAYGLWSDEPLQLSFCHSEGVRPGLAEAFGDWLPRAPRPFGRYDPLCPERWQRNVALRGQDFPDPEAQCRLPVCELARRFDLGPALLRLLVCDGPRLLGWIGAFREEPFGEEARGRLQRLAPALRQRLRLEHQLGQAALHSAALPAVLEALPAAAFLVGPYGLVRQANRAGEALLRRRGAAVRKALREELGLAPAEPSGARPRKAKAAAAKRGGGSKKRARGSPAFALHPLSLPSLHTHHLAIHEPKGSGLSSRLALAAARWRLSVAQERVLAQLVRGASNRTLAARLRLSESTIELHVSRLLAAARVESRAALVAKFYMEVG